MLLKRSEKVFNVVDVSVVGDDVTFSAVVAFCSYAAVFNVEYIDKMY